MESFYYYMIRSALVVTRDDKKNPPEKANTNSNGREVTESEGSRESQRGGLVNDTMSVVVVFDGSVGKYKLSSTPVLSDYTPRHALTAIQLVGTFAELIYGPHHLPYTR